MPPQSAKPPSQDLPSGFELAPAQSARHAASEPDPVSDEALGKDDKIDVTGFKGKWGALTRAQKEDKTKGLSASEQVRLYDALRGGMQPSSAQAAPEFGAETMGNILTGNAERDPWVRQKMANLTNRVLNYLPAVGGTAGGLAGGLAGEAVWPAGGGVAGGVAGASAGGATGEAARQGTLHYLGWDKNDPPMTLGQRGKEVGYAGIENAIAELVGRGAGKIMRPTVERAIKKIYFAGALEHGNPLGIGAVESIYPELAALERTSPVKDTKSLVDLFSKTRRTIGQQVDLLYASPVQQGNRTVQLGNTLANPTPIANRVQDLINKYSINPDINKPVIDMLKKTKTLAEVPRTYRQLADWRIQINDELRGFYLEHPGDQRAILSLHPEKLAMKEIADGIRDVSYPEMDRAGRLAPGTTAQLQQKRGIAIALETQGREHLEGMQTKSKQTAGAAPWKRGNMSGYVTSRGKVGAGVHRVTSILHAPDVLKDADKRAASAFGHTTPAKIGKVLSTRPGMAGLMAVPRAMVTPQAGPAPDVNATPPAQKQYPHTATGANGHRIGSDDGVIWFDLASGEKVE